MREGGGGRWGPRETTTLYTSRTRISSTTLKGLMLHWGYNVCKDCSGVSCTVFSTVSEYYSCIRLYIGCQ